MSRPLPTGISIAHADSLGTTLNSNNYLRETYGTTIALHRVEKEYEGVTAALDANTRLVRVRYSYIDNISAKAYRGLASPADLENLKTGSINFIEASILESLAQLEMDKNPLTKVVMPFYIDETSQLVTGSLIDGELT